MAQENKIKSPKFVEGGFFRGLVLPFKNWCLSKFWFNSFAATLARNPLEHIFPYTWFGAVKSNGNRFAFSRLAIKHASL